MTLPNLSSVADNVADSPAGDASAVPKSGALRSEPPWASAAAFLPLVYRVFPGVSSRVLSDRFLLPWKRLPGLVDGAERTPVRVDGQRASFEISGRGPLVILAHGWSGASGQFATLRALLLTEGFRVATFDAPAHGTSPGRTTSAAQFMRVIEHIARVHGPTLAVVGHSLGALAAAMSVQRVLPKGLVLLAPMPSFDFALDQFQQALRFDDRLRERVAVLVMNKAKIERRHAQLETGLAVGAPTLLIHDSEDRRIPVAVSRDLAERHPHLEYVETEGLGHSRVLVDESVLGRVRQFLLTLRA
jgi:pimeloyl-ACP methyl ester carboxylesterase